MIATQFSLSTETALKFLSNLLTLGSPSFFMSLFILVLLRVTIEFRLNKIDSTAVNRVKF